jgi:hypothetical protein
MQKFQAGNKTGVLFCKKSYFYDFLLAAQLPVFYRKVNGVKPVKP